MAPGCGRMRAIRRAAATRNGESASEPIVAVTTSRCAIPSSSPPARATSAITKLNSPICARHSPAASATAEGMPTARQTSAATIALPQTIAATAPDTMPALAHAQPGSPDRPTAAKKRVSSRVLSGATSARTCAANGELPSRTPATNAPSAAESPTASAPRALPTAHTVAKSAMSSRFRTMAAPRMIRGKTSRTRSRNPVTSSTAPPAVRASCVTGPSGAPPPADIVTAITSGTTARSCVSSTPSESRPCDESSERCSMRRRITTAVLERLTIAPTAKALRMPRPKPMHSAMAAAMVAMTCSTPATNVRAPSARRRDTLNSVPIENRSVAAPSSASASIDSPPCTQPSTPGPTTVPATR